MIYFFSFWHFGILFGDFSLYSSLFLLFLSWKIVFGKNIRWKLSLFLSAVGLNYVYRTTRGDFFYICRDLFVFCHSKNFLQLILHFSFKFSVYFGCKIYSKPHYTPYYLFSLKSSASYWFSLMKKSFKQKSFAKIFSWIKSLYCSYSFSYSYCCCLIWSSLRQ